MADEAVESSNLDRAVMAVTEMAGACLSSVVYTTSDLFFATAPVQYQPYYFEVIRKNQQFYDGFVPALHGIGRGVFSTRIGAALCSGLARKVVGGAVGFRPGAGKADFQCVSWLSHRWAPEVNFRVFARNAIEWALAMGTSLIKLNRDSFGHYYPQTVRMDDFTFSADAQGDLESCRSLVKAYSSTMRPEPGDGKEGQRKAEGLTYFLTELRYFRSGVDHASWVDPATGQRYVIPIDCREPMAVWQVVQCSVASGTQHHILGNAQPLGWDSIPQDVREAINKDYGWILVGKPQRLPFAHGCLGAWLMAAEGYDGTMPNMPVGKSLLRDIYAELAEYDIYESYKNLDVFNGQGMVFTPKAIDMSDLAPAAAVNFSGDPVTVPIGSLPAGNVPQAGNLGGAFPVRPRNTQTIPGDEDKVKPFCNQFDLRVDEWQKLSDGCLRSMATKLHMSPKVISAALAIGGVGEKTATEVDSDDDSTMDWTEEERENFSFPLDKMIECVLSVNGFVGNAEVKFGNVGLRSKKDQVEIVSKELASHLISFEDAIREMNPELDEDQIQAKIAACKAEKDQERADQSMSPFPMGV